ncbi:MAG: SNF2-related protein [bacterium]|nr:SNF2-related protein [bacterium]
MIAFEVGDKLEVTFDLSLSDIDVIVLTPALRFCLPESPQQVPIWIVTETDHTYQAELDNAEGVLICPQLCRMLEQSKTQRYELELLEQESWTYRLTSHVNDPVPSFESSRLVGEQEVLFNVKEDLLILEKLNQGQFEEKRLYDLNELACKIEISPGFDKLLSLQVVRDVVVYPHQIRAVQTVLRRFRGRGLLCDEVGMGKTIESGLVLLEYIMRGLVNKVLILTPPSLMAQWQEEMRRKFLLDFITNDDERFKKAGDQAWDHFDKIIASIHTAKMKRHASYVEQTEYDMIIIDEAHHLKNRNTVTWQFANRLKKKYILMLTATPVQNNLQELFNLITVLKPGQLSTARSFSSEYITRGDRLKPKNSDKLRKLLSEVMVRNKRSQSDIKFTRRYAQTVQLELTPPEWKLYQELTQFIKEGFQQGQINTLILRTFQMEIGSSTFALLPTLEKVRKDAKRTSDQKKRLRDFYDQAKAIKTNAKAEHLLRLISHFNDKIIVFTRFLKTQEYLQKVLDQAGISHALFHGSLHRLEKEKSIHRFRNDVQVLISTESGGEGRNLQFCNGLINYDLPWNPMQIEQRIGRLSRIGQTRDVYIFNFSAAQTIEAYILKLLDAKINMFELVIGEMGMILGNLDEPKEFEDIIFDIWVQSPTYQELEKRIDQFGEGLLAAREVYLRQKAYDESLFGDYFIEKE